MSDLNIGASMTGKRISEVDAERDAIKLAERKARRAELLAKATGSRRGFMLTFFRGRKTTVEV